MSLNTINGTASAESLLGTTGQDSITALAGNDTIQGGLGNDVIDGGSGYNTYVVHGALDDFYWTVNSEGYVLLYDTVVTPSDTVGGADEGTDTLRNIQAIEYLLPDGLVGSTSVIDDYGNAPDAGNYQIEYGVWVKGRANFYGDLDYYKLDTVVGQKVVLSGGGGSTGGYLASAGSEHYIQNQSSYIYSGSDSLLTWTSAGTYDVYWRSTELSSSSPMASKGYSFILRRELDGTDGADSLVAGDNFDYLVGGVGADTLVGSSRSDWLSGGDGEDLLTGGAGNDELDGGSGKANVAVFSGNKADYTATWTGSNLGLTITDTASGRDGTDTLTNVQILRFADGDVVLDAESNVPNPVGALDIGAGFDGSLPIVHASGDYHWVDADYYQQKLAADLTADSALRLTIATSADHQVSGTIYLQFFLAGSSDTLTFTNLGGSGTINQFDSNLSSGEHETSWIVSPLRWGSSTGFDEADAQRADVMVWGYTYDYSNSSVLGELVDYTITLDRVQFGTTGSDQLTGDGLSGYIDARDGNDSVTGSVISEEILGGAGDDTLAGGAGDDVLRDAVGSNRLEGGAGDDLIDVSAGGAPKATIDGGDGVDTLRIATDASWSSLAVSNMEVLDGNGGRTSLSPSAVAEKGFTTARNIVFRLDPGLSTGGTLDAGSLAGDLRLRGTNQSDRLIGNAGDNTIYLGSDENIGSGYGVDTVEAGDGNDTIVWDTRANDQSYRMFSSAESASRTYFLSGELHGGSGQDKLVLDFSDSYWSHPWGYTWDQSSNPSWILDVTTLGLDAVERLEVTGYDSSRFWAFPSEIILTASQIASLSSTSGLRSVGVVGGGAVDLSRFSALGITSWRFGDSGNYQLTGTDEGDTVTLSAGATSASLGAGNDAFVIDGKSLVADTIDGGSGTDTLTVRGTDVDLSGATLAGIEVINVSAQSLSMSADQWTEFGAIVSKIAGASTKYILSVGTPGTYTLASDSSYVGLTGSSGDDILVGNAGANILVGGTGNDSMSGNAGDDRLVTGVGTDTLAGGDGADTLVVADKATVRDYLEGGAGIDTLEVSDGQDLTLATIKDIEALKGTGTVTMNAAQLAGFSSVSGVSVKLSGDSLDFSLGSIVLTNGAEIHLPTVDTTIAATEGILGSRLDDTITGGTGADVIYGGRGVDIVYGNAGNDTLIGGSGADTLLGGAGDDRFVVNASEFTSSSQIVVSDHIDGGEGDDTLAIEFNYTQSWDTYSIADGAVSNIDSLTVWNGYYSTVRLSASLWSSLNSVSAMSTDSSSSYRSISFIIAGNGGDIAFDSIEDSSKVRKISLSGTYADIDAVAESGVIYEIEIGGLFDTIEMGAGDDRLRVTSGDSAFSVIAGDGDDWVHVSGVRELDATISGGEGSDTLDIHDNGFIDISSSTLTSVDSIYYGASTIVVTQAQLDSLSFDGSGAKYVRTGNTIVGSASDDSYEGDGSGSFQGGKGDDLISYVDTAVFTGNSNEYDVKRSGSALTVEHARGDMLDGSDTLTGVMNLKFADTIVQKDDAPDDYWNGHYIYSDLTVAAYAKPVSAKKDFASDTDLFAGMLAPNSPLAVEGSSFNGNPWYMEFRDVETGQQIQFKSLVTGYTYYQYYSWMVASQKWLPGFNTADGFVAYQGGDVVFRVNLDGGIQDYAFTLNYLDDYAGGIDTLGEMDPEAGLVRGYVGDISDADWIRTSLIGGTKYEFHLNGVSSDGGSLVDPLLELRDSAGRLVESGVDIVLNGTGNDDTIVFRPILSGDYYLAVTDVAGISKGSWTLTQQSLDMIAGNVSTTERIEWSGADTFTVSSEINQFSDHDWFKVWLDKGMTYSFRDLGTSGGGTLGDPQLSIRSVTGILLAQDDNSGGSTDAKLFYSAPDSGWYYLDAGASGNTGKGTYKLLGSTLADDYSNDLFTTGLVELGTPEQGLVSYIGDSDWFRVGLTAGKTYVIDLVGDSSDSAQLDPLGDPLLIIRDGVGNMLYRADDFNGTLDARAYFTPTTTGLYNLEAKSAFKYDIGAYSLSVTLAPPDDYGNTIAAASTAITVGTALSGTIGLPGDRDMLSVALESGRVYQVSLEGLAGHGGTLTDPYLRVFDAAGHLIDYDNNGGTGNDASLYLAPSVDGTYYIEASSSKDKAMGTYELSVAQRDLPPDDVPNNVGSTVTLSPGDSFSGMLLAHNDEDWFKIELQGGKDYVFRLKAAASGNGTLADPLLEIHAADGTLIKAVDDMLVSNEPATAFSPLADGVYYLAVKAHDGQVDTGSYVLVTRAPDDYSNTKPGAHVIILEETLEGAIQWSDGAFGVRAYDSLGLATDMDEDWFQFNANKEQVLSFNVSIADGSLLSRPMVEIVDEQGRSLAVADGLETDGGLAAAVFAAPAAGTYFARVIDGAGATGAYEVTLVEGDASDEDAGGAVQMQFSVSGAVTKAESTALIGLSGDSDAFSVALQDGHSYRIETLALRDGSHAPLPSASLSMSWLEQGAASPETVEPGREAGEASFFDSALYRASAAGTMSIAVAPLEATQTGKYMLRVTDLGTSEADDRPDAVTDYLDAASGLLAANENALGKIDASGDVDLFAINLTAGNLYDFSIKSFADGLGTLAESRLMLLDDTGLLVTTGAFETQSGRSDLAVSVFENGRYYLSVSAADLPGNIGTYVLDTRLRDTSVSADDIAADTRSGVSVAPGRSAAGSIDYAGDSDWVKASLDAGKVYVIDVLGDGDGVGGTLLDSTLRLIDSTGNDVAFDDDSGAGLDSHLQFSPDSTADFFLAIGSNGTETGTYTVRVRELYGGVADPLESAQWYLDALGLGQLDSRITGAGVRVGVVDEGIDINHPDLKDNLDFSLAYDTQFDTQDGQPKYPVLRGMPPDNHGTAVAGIIASVANNETGIVGIAPDAELVSTRVKWSYDQITQALGLQWQFDVSNNSWGATSPFGDNFNSTELVFAWQALRTGVEDGREGLGTVFVFSAGNSAAYGENTNYHNFQNAREVLTVAAANDDGSVASFSTPGANVLVGAYGVGLLTTDRLAGLGYTGSNYTTFSGTSAAAPVVSGVVALMLEANPDLGYRDVQKILAYSASHPDNQDWKENGAYNWNLGGLKFNDSMGFGLVDAYAAVTLAETWSDVSTTINEVSDSARAFGLNLAIPDGDGTALSRTFTIDNAMLVEHIELGVDLRHMRLGDIIIEITSPNGTVSTLMDRPTVNAEQPFGLSGDDSGVPTHLLWDFSSVQFWGEEAAGEWTITLKDVRAEETGTLNSLSLRVYGEREDGNDVYVFTEEGFLGRSSTVLSDEGGHDVINASPMQHDLYVNVGEGIIAAEGVIHEISEWSVIEDVVTGSGNDRVVGNDAANIITTRDGDDTVQGGLGNDTIDGGKGSDTAVYLGAAAEYSYSWNPDTRVLRVVDNRSSNGDEGIDLLTGIERIVFSDSDVSLGVTVGNHAPVAAASVFDDPVMVAKGMGLDFDLPDNAFSDQDGEGELEITVRNASGGELPDWLSYDPATGKFSGVPPEDMQGQLQILVEAVDGYGESTSDILTIQFGDNQAPVVDTPSEKVIGEDAALLPLGIKAPVDPEETEVVITMLAVPTIGAVLDKGGNPVAAGDEFTPDELSELHYQTAADANGDAGYLRYEAKDEDGVKAESSIHLFIDPVNDAPRFSPSSSTLVINYPSQSVVSLDMVHPSDPESTISTGKVIGLPEMGRVTLDGQAVALNQLLTMDQLDRLTFTLAENVNGPIGGITIQAVDPEGLATDWTLSLEVQGENYSNVGTAGGDPMYGSIGNDTLYGMSGNDTLVGNAGDDRLLGGLGNDSLFGGSGSDALDGSSGNDYIDGGSGSDVMSGGPGHDTYVVDSLADTVLEVISGGAGGNDLIVSSVSLSAPQNVENLQAADGAQVDLTGNLLDNILLGNALANSLYGSSGRDTLLGGGGDDVLNGGTGIDRMAGGTGDDTYHVDSRFDVIVEQPGEGTDTVHATSSFTLFSNLENLVLEEGGDYTAGGNSLNNHIYGNSGSNIIAGGIGADTLEGGLGDDTYVLTDSLDTIIDTGGNDTVRSSLDVTLMAGMENIELIGVNDTVAVGNGAANRLVGNMGDNILDGAGGVDTLTGGTGSDQFILSSNGADADPDQVTDFSPGEDLLVLDFFSLGIDPDAVGLQSSGTVGEGSFVKGTGAYALDPDDYYLLDTARGLLLFDADGSGSGAPVELVKLVGVGYEAMTGADLYVAV
ncbi:MAG: S8 family serine peptidase [Chlorobium phaeovibrioides]|nr:S8 family serine peptidase [Chlorobium phaeovibrioides]